MQSLFALRCRDVGFSSCRLSSSSVKPSIISRIRYVLNHYWLGSKLFYQNFKSIQQIRKKDENSLTRIENLSLDQFRYDIRVGIPFVLLFSIPIIGYSAPILALIAPKYVPSTFIIPKQKVKFLNDDANASSSIIDSFIQFSKQQYNDNTIYGVIPTIQFIDQVSNSRDRFDLIMSSIPSYSSLFVKCFPLSLFPREHLLILHQSVLHSSFLARYFLVNYSLECQLEMWEYRCLIDDKKLINIDKLSQYELVSALYSRGLFLHLNQMGQILQDEQTQILNKVNKKVVKSNNEEMKIDENILNDWKQLLYQWIQIHKKVSLYNPISTSFLLHIAPLLTKS